MIEGKVDKEAYEKIVASKRKFSIAYCKKKGWDRSKLTVEQIKEMRYEYFTEQNNQKFNRDGE